MLRKAWLLYAWTAATREPLRNWETHYLLLTHLESLISYMLFCYLAAEWNSSSKNRKKKKWTTHQWRIIFSVDSSRSPATASKECPGGFSVCLLCPFIYCWFPLWQHYQPLQRLPCSSLCFSRFRHWVFTAFGCFQSVGVCFTCPHRAESPWKTVPGRKLLLLLVREPHGENQGFFQKILQVRSLLQRDGEWRFPWALLLPVWWIPPSTHLAGTAVAVMNF